MMRALMAVTLFPISLFAEQPIARIAVIANPYITTLPAKELKDERGASRPHVAAASQRGMEQTIAVVNRMKPDALVVLGSLTWSGSKADQEAAAKHLDTIEVPLITVPGHRDWQDGSLEVYKQAFAKPDASKSLRTVNGVSLVFAEDLHGDPTTATARIRQQLAKADTPKAVLLFADRDTHSAPSKLRPDDKAFWDLVEKQHIAAQIEPTRYAHHLDYTNTLPIWRVGSSGWNGSAAVTLVKVYADRIEMSEVGPPEQPTFGLTVPNPVEAPRMISAEEDPYGCPTYSADLAKKPNFTFALVSDPQFDREQGRKTLIDKAEKAIAELNRLSPAKVFVAGDLVNNNLPEEWQLFNETFAQLEPPRHVVPGNHDVLFNYNFIEKSYSSAPKDKPKYAEIVKKALADATKDGFTGPTALYEKYTGSKPRQAIEYRDCVFITVPFLTQRADAEQLKYLREQLAKTTGEKHVFVVAHYPSLPAFGNNVQPQLGGDDVLAMLLEHRVTGYLFGHRHRNGFRMHERTAHVLTDNMSTIHLFHVFDDRVVLCRKRVGTPLYEKLVIPSPRAETKP